MSAPKTPVPGQDPLLVAGVVHDVNQMLAVITGRAGLLLSQGTDPRWEPHLRAIALAADDAALMLRRLSVAREEGIPATGAELHDVLEQARLLVWPGEDQAYRWLNEVPAGLSAKVPAQVLREVLNNLLLNALAVMPTGGEVRARAIATDGGRVQLSLADSGPGLAAGDEERIFELGVTGSGQTGRGVGLAGCRRLLAGVQGSLTAAARKGQAGTVFTLDLPLGVAPADVVSPATGTMPPMDVLVVDDEAGVREMLVDVLGSLGCRVKAWRDGPAALAGYVPGTAAVALIDRNLPGLDGVELARSLRDNDPCLSIVLMTGWQGSEGEVPPDPASVDQQAAKPLGIARMREILQAGYEQWSARRQA